MKKLCPGVPQKAEKSLPVSGRLLHCSEVSAHGIVFVGGGDAGVVVDALQGLIIQEIGEFRIGPDKGGQGQYQQRGRQCGEEHGQTDSSAGRTA